MTTCAFSSVPRALEVRDDWRNEAEVSSVTEMMFEPLDLLWKWCDVELINHLQTSAVENFIELYWELKYDKLMPTLNLITIINVNMRKQPRTGSMIYVISGCIYLSIYLYLYGQTHLSVTLKWHSNAFQTELQTTASSREKKHTCSYHCIVQKVSTSPKEQKACNLTIFMKYLTRIKT